MKKCKEKVTDYLKRVEKMIRNRKIRNIIMLVFLGVIFIDMFFNYISFHSDENIYARIALVISYAIIAFGMCYCLPRSLFFHKLEDRAGIYLFVFWIITIISTLINSSRVNYSYAEMFSAICLYLAVFFISSAVMRQRFNLQIISDVSFLVECIFFAIFLYHRLTGMNYMSSAINTVYFIVTLLPIILLNRNNIIKFIGIAIILFSTIISDKRTALIMIFVSLCVYFLLFIFSKKASMVNKFKIVLILAGIVGVVYVMYTIIASQVDIFTFDRLQSAISDGGSGRLDMFALVIKEIKGFTFSEWLTGKGFNGVFNFSVVGNSAHNDFLEVTYDYGIFGILFYILFILRIGKKCIRMMKRKTNLAIAGIVSIVMFAIMSCFSHLILYPTYFIYFIILWSAVCHEDNAF